MRAGRLLGMAATVLLIVAAIGLACWLVFSAATGATLITFRTGSMAPTMPQGSLAVSLPVDAAEIEIGDVVTVPRHADGVPVTHRVVEVRGSDTASAATPLAQNERELVLKGDDNDTVDMRPYVVAEARRVLFAVPGMGAGITLLQSPPVMGALVIGAGALTAWAFWPRKEQSSSAMNSQHPEEVASQ